MTLRGILLEIVIAENWVYSWLLVTDESPQATPSMQGSQSNPRRPGSWT